VTEMDNVISDGSIHLVANKMDDVKLYRPAAGVRNSRPARGPLIFCAVM
jgi:hypothetical protein